MIDLTPLDVRKKRGDFKKSMRGYEPQEVDTFLDLVAERMEELVKETIGLRERAERLQVQVEAQASRERAVQEALVTAQSLREEMREQSRREADLARREAEVEAQRLLADADRRLEERRAALEELERKRARFLRSFRALLERELDVVVVEEGRSPLEDRPVDLDLGGGRSAPSLDATDRGEPTREVVVELVAERSDPLPPLEGDDFGPVADAPDPSEGEEGPGELWLTGLGESATPPRTGD